MVEFLSKNDRLELGSLRKKKADAPFFANGPFGLGAERICDNFVTRKLWKINGLGKTPPLVSTISGYALGRFANFFGEGSYVKEIPGKESH